MKKALPYLLIAAVVLVGVITYTGISGVDMADPPRGGFISPALLNGK